MPVDTPAAATQFAELQSRIVNSLLLTMRVDAPAERRLQFCLPTPSSAPSSAALAHERFERGDLRLVAVEILRDLLVEMRGAGIELVCGGILTDEIGDLVHLRDPAIGLGRHEREVALEPRQHLRLAARQLGEQR